MIIGSKCIAFVDDGLQQLSRALHASTRLGHLDLLLSRHLEPRRIYRDATPNVGHRGHASHSDGRGLEYRPAFRGVP